MFGQTITRAATAAQRTFAAPILASALALASLGPSTTLGVAAAPADPHARLEVVVKSVRIHDDNEGILSGEGEMQFFYGVWRCKGGSAPPCHDMIYDNVSEFVPSSVSGHATALIRAGSVFNASTGEVVTLNRQVPGPGDVMWGDDTSPETGFAVLAGQPHVLRFDMNEWDGEYVRDEYLGHVHHVMSVENLSLGIHTARSIRPDGSAGDYTVTYEIRRVPLPDLKPVNIKVFDLPGNAKKQVCMAVQNIDVVHASPFEVQLKVDDKPVPGATYTIGVLASGTHFDACVDVALPSSGQHKLTAVVDESRALTESNEANNVYEQQYRAPGSAAPPAEPATPSTPSAALPDLVVTAIKVNGRVPDGKDDCKDGKNEVTVVVKNQGPTRAGDFFVRLVAEGAVAEQSVPGLDAGKEREVRFDDVRLKKGQRSLSATADATDTIAEARDDNNERKVTATCKDDE